MRKGYYRDIVFWFALLTITAYTVYLQVWDTGSYSYRTEALNANASSYLHLNHIDTSSKVIKAKLFIPSFRKPVEPPVDNNKKVESRSKKAASRQQEPVNKRKLTVMVDSVSENPTDHNPENDTIKELTLDDKSDKKTEDEISWFPIDLQYKSNHFYYPFESYILDFHIDFKKNKPDDQSQIIEVPLRLEVKNKINDLVMRSCFPDYSFKDAQVPGTTNNFSVILTRNPYPKIIAIVISAAAIVFLFFISRLEETSKVISNSLGYLATVWACRQIILGPVTLFPTIVDMVTLALFICVLAIVIYKSLHHKSMAALTAQKPRSRVKLFRKLNASRSEK